MDFKVDCQFVFRSVGQGLFYTGKIDDFLFVYDCGSNSSRDLRYLKNSIEDFSNEVNANKLGLLVISHFDSDHINGLQILSKNFTDIDTIVVPYLDPVARLLIYLNNPGQMEEYYGFLVDPITYLSSHFHVRQILVLGGNDDDHDENILEDELNPDSPLEHWFRQPMKLYQQFGQEDRRLKEKVEINEQLHVGSMAVDIRYYSHKGFLSLAGIWKFMFFNYDREDQVVALLKNVMAAKQIKCNTLADLHSIVQTPSKLNELKECYRRFIPLAKSMSEGNITEMNNTSLVLFHGPMRESETQTRYFHEKKRKIHHIITTKIVRTTVDELNSKGLSKRKLIQLGNRLRTMKLAVGYNMKKNFKLVNLNIRRLNNHNKTILFGDLNATRDLDQILKHFGRIRLTQLCTVLVPHHGSKGYWNQELLLHFFHFPTIWVANFGVTNTYGHPDPNLIEQLKDFQSDNVLAFNNEVNQIRQRMRVNWEIEGDRILSSQRRIRI